MNDLISRQAVLNSINSVMADYIPFLYGEFDKIPLDLARAIMKVPSVQPEPIVTKCKDCNEWHKGENKYGDCCYSDEGFCCVHSMLTGENYYCGDAERR